MGIRWQPLDCTCELEFVNGVENPPIHITKCPAHIGASGKDVWDENRLANKIRAENPNAVLEFVNTGSGPRDILVK